jgi:hypothetical protein
MLWQPHKCDCFGGRCWKQFCPNREDNRKKKKSQEDGIEIKKRKHDLDIRVWHPEVEGDTDGEK